MSLDIQTTIDATGLICPEPIMMLHAAVRDAQVGDIIKLIATDPSAKKDVIQFCEFLGHELVEQTEESGTLFFFLRKGR